MASRVTDGGWGGGGSGGKWVTDGSGRVTVSVLFGQCKGGIFPFFFPVPDERPS